MQSMLSFKRSTSVFLNTSVGLGDVTSNTKRRRFKQTSKRTYLTDASVLPEWLQNRKEFTERYMKTSRTNLIDKACTCERHSSLRNAYEKKVLLEWVSGIPDLCWVSRPRLVDMCNRLATVHFRKNDCLMAKGDAGDCMYLLLDGEVGVYLEDMALAAILQANNAVGEASLRTSEKRTATVIALTDVVALRLYKADYEGIVLREMLQERRDTCTALRSAQFFCDLQHSKLENLADKVYIKKFEAGHKVYSAGDLSSCIYIVKTGCVKLEAQVKLEQIRKWPSGVRKWALKKICQHYTTLLRLCRAGEVFGEKEVLGQKERNHSAETTERSVIILMNTDTFTSNFTPAELQSLAQLNEDRPDTPHIVQSLTQKITRDRQFQRALMDGLEYNPCPIGRDYGSPKGIRSQRLNKICRK